jgi:hypothetical protein
MSAPSHHLRTLRENAARRRLELAKLLRDDPKATNIQLAKALNVNRDTIALDRKVIMEQLQNDARTETEQLRAKLVGELEELKFEVEQHRKQGRLPLAAIDQLLAITKAVIDLTGARKPVNEKMTVQHRTMIPQFNAVIVGSMPTIDALGDGNGSR